MAKGGPGEPPPGDPAPRDRLASGREYAISGAMTNAEKLELAGTIKSMLSSMADDMPETFERVGETIGLLSELESALQMDEAE